jgi:hypothetical protein
MFLTFYNCLKEDFSAMAAPRHFRDAPAEIERLCPELTAMGSGYASVWGRDGICAQPGLDVIGGDRCSAFAERTTYYTIYISLIEFFSHS